MFNFWGLENNWYMQNKSWKWTPRSSVCNLGVNFNHNNDERICALISLARGRWNNHASIVIHAVFSSNKNWLLNCELEEHTDERLSIEFCCTYPERLRKKPFWKEQQITRKYTLKRNHFWFETFEEYRKGSEAKFAQISCPIAKKKTRFWSIFIFAHVICVVCRHLVCLWGECPPHKQQSIYTLFYCFFCAVLPCGSAHHKTIDITSRLYSSTCLPNSAFAIPDICAQ